MNSTTKFWFFFGIISTDIVVIDQITKWFARQYFTAPIPIVQNVLWLEFHFNTNSAFGLPIANSIMRAAILIVLIGLLLFIHHMVKKDSSNPITKAVVLSFIIGGGIGNFVDRVFFGGVTDFIATSFWPTFNFADTFITIGAFFIIYSSIARHHSSHS